MAKDKETGIDPKAKDGDPGPMDNEIEERRRLKEEREREDERRAAGKKGQPIDDQPETGEEDDGQLFVWEQGRKVSLGTLIPRGVPVEHALVFTQARRKGAGKLIGFEDDVLLIIRGKVGSVKPVAKRDADENVEAVTIETQINPKVVAPADSEQGMSLLAAVFERRGIKAA